jgi:molybdenum cofactor cytidylyltransferase
MADQYAIGSSDLDKLARAWAREPQAAAAAIAGSGPGAPAVLPRSYFPQVMDLQGDRGARSLLRDPDRLVAVVELPAAAHDLDERDDLRRFNRVRRRLSWPRR